MTELNKLLKGSQEQDSSQSSNSNSDEENKSDENLTKSDIEEDKLIEEGCVEICKELDKIDTKKIEISLHKIISLTKELEPKTANVSSLNILFIDGT